MGEGKCYHCKKEYFTERIVICLDCLRQSAEFRNADLIFHVKDLEHCVLSGADIEFSLEIIEKFTIPSLKKKLKKLKDSKKEKIASA